MTAEAIAIVGVGAALLAALVPLLLVLAAGIRRELDAVRGDVGAIRTELRADMVAIRTELRADVAEVRADVAEVRRDVHALTERVARVEGALTGPWRAPMADPEPTP